MSRKSYIRTSCGRIIATDRPDYYPTETRLSAKAGREAYRAQCSASLRELLADNATVWCVLRHVSASGMSRRIDFYTIQSGDMRCLSGLISGALDYAPMHPTRGGLVIQGCGMDMGFHVVESTARAIGRKLAHRWL